MLNSNKNQVEDLKIDNTGDTFQDEMENQNREIMSNKNEKRYVLTIYQVGDTRFSAGDREKQVKPRRFYQVCTTSEIPEVSVKEIDTVVNIKDKHIIVMGGLIDQSHIVKETGVPFLQDIPLLGFLFKSYSNEIVATETVIFIKATIINNNTPIDIYDKGFYKSFTTDPRPLIF